MKQFLQTLGYHLNEHGVWQRPEFSGIAYSDGDEIENRIWQAIASCSDRSVLSTDLKRHCTDWPSLYHLSGTRANLMRPLQDLFKGDILEIGAGCGAISRYLGECTAGTDSRLLALEGSPRRAAIARARTQGLDHVTVVTEQFDTFAPARQFDMVTLIGVLEYANLFTGGPTAALSMLQRARQLVKQGGHLVIAIENQFGLKYFAGAPEDHLGTPMVGIESRYANTQAKTFGKKALQALLRQAGFAHDTFLAPFPDYKLPVSVISEAGMRASAFDAAALACQSVRKDPQLPAALHFSPELAWPDLFANGLGMDLSNSFLVVASDTTPAALDSSVLAWHYSAERRPEFCKETRFTQHGDTPIQVTYLPLGPSSVSAEAPLSYSPGSGSAYVQGICLSWRFIRSLEQDGWTVQQLADLLADYLGVLRSHLPGSEASALALKATTALPGQLFDAVPHNIIETAPRQFTLIDTEWASSKPIELGHLLFRAALLTLSSMSRVGIPADVSIRTRGDFVHCVMTSSGLQVSNAQLQGWMEKEAQLQSFVTGYGPERFSEWEPHQALNTRALSHAQYERVEQLAQHHERLLVSALEAKQAIENSTTWRLMAPVRAALNALRGR